MDMKKIGDNWQADENNRRNLSYRLSHVYDGAVLKYVRERCEKDFIKKSQVEEIVSRALPINIPRRVVDKIATAYKDKPNRSIEGAGKTDQDLFDYYNDAICFNTIGTRIDRTFCMFRECLIRPYFNAKTGKPAIRIYQPYQYQIINNNEYDPCCMDAVVLDYGITDDKKQLLQVFTEQEWWIQNVAGERQQQFMNSMENPDGVNAYGRLPFIHLNGSETSCMPLPDEAFFDIATLIPLLFGDINYAIKYMSFGIIWSKNVAAGLTERSPNALWELKPADTTLAQVVQPEIGCLSPTVNTREVVDTIVQELGIWLNTRGIRPSTISASAESFSSGLSKMIDEADVTQLVQGNQTIYAKMEKELFDFIIKAGHAAWSSRGAILMPLGSFSASAEIKTEFVTPQPIKARAEIIDEQTKQIDAGLTTKKRAIAAINPELDEAQIEEILSDIKGEDDARRLATDQYNNSQGFKQNGQNSFGGAPDQGNA